MISSTSRCLALSLLLAASLFPACGEPELGGFQDEDKGDLSSFTLRLSNACDVLLNTASGVLDPSAIQDLVDLANLPVEQQDEALSSLGVSVKDGWTYTYNVGELRLGVCAGAYVVISTTLQAMRLSIAGLGGYPEQYGYFLALAVSSSQVEAQTKVDKLAALLPGDPQLAPVIYESDGLFYVLHNSCALRYSDMLAADMTRLLTARAALLTELWQATGAYDPQTEMGTLSATLALIPRGLHELDAFACLP